MKVIQGRIELNSIELAKAAARYVEAVLDLECTGRVRLSVGRDRPDQDFIYASVELGPYSPPPVPIIEAIDRG
jgi:hypothetical protein